MLLWVVPHSALRRTNVKKKEKKRREIIQLRVVTSRVGVALPADSHRFCLRSSSRWNSQRFRHDIPERTTCGGPSSGISGRNPACASTKLRRASDGSSQGVGSAQRRYDSFARQMSASECLVKTAEQRWDSGRCSGNRANQSGGTGRSTLEAAVSHTQSTCEQK